MAADTTNSPLGIPKTYKLFIGGKFPRSESGRSFAVAGADGAFVANAAQASRKDVRDAVGAARKAVSGWSGATAYNRGQVLYRVAEILDGRREQFVAELTALGLGKAAARSEVDAAIATWVYYAGWSDKYAQVLGNANPVAAPYFNFSMPEHTGVVAIIAPQRVETPLSGLAATVAPAIVSGNTVVVIPDEQNPLAAISFAEVLATSDIPAGVVNVLTGYVEELAPILAGHMDINAIDLAGVSAEGHAGLAALSVENLKRVIPPRTLPRDGNVSLEALSSLVELKTVWHPIGV